ncbi:TAXI family TRAP transporter solute-binding subunit [Kibdelosporangium philippinense]|uniref:TAXI family TRAP transporter solute-binding subunit n=1 Tax=Kibdelosporangium philippinense TaxID=211113 RepID=UPI00360D52F1
MRRTLIGVLGLALVATGCGGKREDAPTAQQPANGACEAADGRVTIATGNVGGVYYVLGGGLAQVISNNSKLKATAADTGASVQNIQQLGDKTYDIAFSLADTAADAVEGKSAFEGKPQKVQALARIYSNYTQVLVRTDSGINSVVDFRGKRISTGSPKSGTEVIANRLLQAAGLKDADLSPQRLALRQTVDGMKEGKIDGLVWSGGLPTPEITDLTTSMGDKVKFIDITRSWVRSSSSTRSTTRAPSRPRPTSSPRTCRPSSCRTCCSSGRLPGRERVRDHQADLRQEGGFGKDSPVGKGHHQRNGRQDRSIPLHPVRSRPSA